jgi:hypothetical protein
MFRKTFLALGLLAGGFGVAYAAGVWQGYAPSNFQSYNYTGMEFWACDTANTVGGGPATVGCSGPYSGSPAQGPLTALAGGGRTGATQLNLGLNQVGTVATANDSVVLPPALKGEMVIVKNSAANAMQVFAAGSDTINGTAGATGLSQLTLTGAIYIASANGTWFRMVGTG